MTTVGATIGFLIFAAAALITAVISAVLFYHWVRYGVSVFGMLTAMIVYTVGTIGILLMLLGLTVQL